MNICSRRCGKMVFTFRERIIGIVENIHTINDSVLKNFVIPFDNHFERLYFLNGVINFKGRVLNFKKVKCRCKVVEIEFTESKKNNLTVKLPLY